MSLTADQIAVVVQGPVMAAGDLTSECLRGLRRLLPGAQLILSTWEGSETAGLECDDVVISADPGPGVARLDGGSMVTNVNRQIISTRAGLEPVARPYTLKSRTDLLLEHAGFLQFFGRWSRRAPGAQLFAERVLILDHFSRSPARGRAPMLESGEALHEGRREPQRSLAEMRDDERRRIEVAFADFQSDEPIAIAPLSGSAA